MRPSGARLFVALWPPAGVRDRLSEIARAAALASRGRAMRPETLHLTLAFIGELARERVTEAAHALAVANGLGPIPITLDVLGRFGAKGIVWAGPAAPPPALGSLAGRVREALAAAAIPFDPKPFVPHITVVRNARGAATFTLAPLAWRIDRVSLVESVPADGVRRYEERAGVAL